jgi:hypothetical protein
VITIYGYSDDLVEVEGCAGADEFNTDNWLGELAPPGEGEQLRVHCWYDTSGCWQVGVGQVDEDMSLPDWPLRIRQGTDKHEAAYTVVLEIDAPEGTRLVNVQEGVSR